MAAVENPFAPLIPRAAPPANPFASLIPQQQEQQPAQGWIEGAIGGATRTGERAMAQLGQGYSQLMLEHTAQRAADRQKSFSDILQEEKLDAGMVDMQGRPIETAHGGEYISAAARWLDARYADLIGTDDEAAAKEYATSMQENMERRAAIPKSEIATEFQKQAMVKDATLGQTLANFGKAILQNPLGGLSWALETAGESLPSMAAGTATTLLTKSPAAGLAVMGGGSYATERYTSPGEFFQEKGLDLKKPEDVQKLLNDPKLMQEAANRGVIRGLVIGAFDLLSGHLAGTVLAKNPLVEAVAQSLTQAIYGAGGEAGARALAGQELDWNEVAAEGFAEMATLPLDMITAGRGQEQAAPPPPAGGPPPPGAAPAETILPPEPPPPAAPGPPAPTPAPAPTPEEVAAAASFDEEVARQIERPFSQRLTELDRQSPIPNEIIDDGKALVEGATGRESTFTTTTEINGKREVVTGKVSDLVAANRAQTQAVIQQITAGVSQPEILAQAQPAAAPAAAAEAPATAIPTQAAAAVEAPVATPEAAAIEDVSDDAHPRAEDTRSFEEFVAKAQAHADARQAQARNIAAAGKSVRMVHPKREGQRALVGPDMAEPGMFRVTRFTGSEPFGHTTYNTLEEAANDALREGYVPVAPEPAAQADLKARVETQRAATPTPEQPQKIEVRPVRDDAAITASGREVPVTYAVVEADSLIASQRDEGGVNPAYPAELQPRDRSRTTSDQQISQIANNLDPRLLDQNPNASDGAPIISEGGVVESGNGRVLAVRRAYNEDLPTAEGYRQYLAQQGYPVDGMRRPVLVRVRKGELAAPERAAFTREANERTTMAMSATERAMADAAAMRPEVVSLYRGGEIEEAGNREFVRGFMQSVVSPNEQAAMVTPQGTLSQEAIRRLQAALLARAYGDPDLVGALVESTDNNIKAIGGALMDVAGEWAQMRSEAAEGTISPDADITDRVMEAVRLVQRARNEGRPLFEYVNQRDVFSGDTIHQDAEAVLQLLFRNIVSWTQPAGREKIADALRFYATEARKTTAGTDLLGEKAASPRQILEAAKRRQYGEEATQEKLALGGRATGKDVGAPSQERAVKAEPRPQAEKRPTVPAETRPPKLEKGPRTRPYLPKPPAEPARTEDLSPEQAMAEAVRIDGERRAREKAEREGKGKNTPKFMLAEPVEPDIPQLPETLFQKLRKRLTTRRMRRSEDAMLRVPRTNEKPGDTRPAIDPKTGEIIQVNDYFGAYVERFGEFDSDKWWATRIYNLGKTAKGKLDEAVDYLLKGAKELATKEINEARDQLNRELKEKGKEPIWGHVPDYEVANDRVAIVIMGPPAAGKSTIANAIAYLWKAAISDVDEAKKVIPEYTAPDGDGKMLGGIGANAVHIESSKLGIAVTNRLMDEGANLIIPTVGDSVKKVDFLREMLEAKGYKVHLVLMDVAPQTSVGRMIGRFIRTGRLIPPLYFLDVVRKPPYIYEAVKGNFDGYTKVYSDNRSDARVTETSGALRIVALGDRIDRAGEIRSGGTGVAKGRGGVRQGPPAQAKAKVGEPTARAPPAPRTVTREVQGGRINFRPAQRFSREKRNQVFTQLRKALDKLGLRDVDLKVWQQIFADMDYGAFSVDGLYMKNVIDIALNSDPMTVLHHEAIHALFDLKLFSRMERSILRRASMGKWITDEIKARYPEEQWIEEGIAHAYTAWLNGAKMDGVITKSFKKIQTFLKELARTLTGFDLRNSDDIFRQVTSGEIGGRSQRGRGVEITLVERPGYAVSGNKETRARVGTALDQAYSELHPNPLAENQIGFGNAAGTAMAMTELENYGDSLYVKWLSAFPQQSGMGTQLMNYLKELATQHNVPLTLTPWKLGKLGEKKLSRIFEGWGFEKGKQGLFWWHPPGAPKFSLPTETVDMFEGPREQFVIPGAEKVSEKQLAELRAKAPLRGKVPQKSVEALPLFGDEKDQLALFSIPPKQTTVNGHTEADPTAPRFMLQTAPHSQQQAAQVTQGFLNRGQPFDRAIRVPFALLGGTDSQGRLNIGKRLSDRMGPAGRQGLGIGGILGAGVGGLVAGPPGAFIGGFAGGSAGAYILASKPWPTTGAFGFLGHFAENAKRGLIDGYGLDPEYLEAYRKSDLGKTSVLRQAQGILKVLSNAGVSDKEAKVLQAILTGENVNDADMAKLAVPIRKAIDDMGAEAVSLGLISAESFERNRGAYLHRVYAKHEVDQSTLAGWVSAKMANRRKKIIGDELKGRGIFMDVDSERLMRDVETFKAGTRGAPVKGEDFRVIDEVSTMNDLTTGKPVEKVLRRIYLPANEAVPAKYKGANWVDRGTWEARQTGKKVTLWRDYTKAERDKMGELTDARYTIAKTFMLMANDLSTGRFFKDVSEKAEWTRSTPPPDGTWKEASEYGRFWEDPEIRWVKVPDTSIAKTGGKKRWGALSGKYVRAEIWRDLNEINIAQNPTTWRQLQTQWKKNKTARNPVVHMNNIMSNVMFMDLADVRAQDFVAGVQSYFKADANYREALENGAFGSDVISQEIRDEVFKPILDAITKQTTGAGNPFLARAGLMGVVADKLWTWAKTADNGMLRAYQAEDEMFRMATYMRRRSQGESPRMAAQHARDQFLNYDIRAPWVVAARNTVLPFVSYSYRAIPKLAENIMHRPWKLAKYVAIAYAVNALAYMMDDGDDGEERERAALRDEEQGFTWLQTPRMIRMPWRDAHGLPVFLDIRRWIPAGDIFDTTQGSSALPIPAPLQFGGLLQMGFEFMQNRETFTGEDITNSLTQDNLEKASSVADWAWKSWAPGSFWTPYSWYWTKIANALYGATDAAGRPYSVPQALLSSVGIKLKPVDVEDGIKWHMYDFKKVQDALKQDMRAEARRLERGLISQSAFDKALARTLEKNQQLGKRVEEFSGRVRKKEPAQ